MMKINVMEQERSTLKIELSDDDLTLANLINENLWQQKDLESAAYAKQHPTLGKPIFLVKSKNPKKSLTDACEQIIDDVKDLKKDMSHLK
ncbi:MAG: hypothetical protein HY832_02110 [Candidatus Aenigmarchaeota archaeon]|nr:hypothetical protein [Candidatus Aenigmarchaeota archaeon]